MSRQEKQLRQQKIQADVHQRQVRRNQTIFIVLSVILILSMVLSMVIQL
jgi:hypothetical protein